MIRQLRSKGSAPSLAYAAMNTAVWVIYVTLVLLATQVVALHTPVAVAASTLVAAIVLYPLRRRASGAARRRFDHQSPQAASATAGSRRFHRNPGERRPGAST
jgi:Flp pilus assembly protein TadB